MRDAGTVASWGAIRWRAAVAPGQVEVFTRSGNTANAGRDLERVVEGLHATPTASRSQPERPLPAVARRVAESTSDVRRSGAPVPS